MNMQAWSKRDDTTARGTSSNGGRERKATDRLDMFEAAAAMDGTLRLCDITQRELGERMGVSQSYIANKLRLLNLPCRLREKIRASGISERHARALLRLSDERSQDEILDKVIERRLTVRECEALVDAAVEHDAPLTISRAERSESISLFSSTVDKCVESLRSHGIEARRQTNYIGGKMYITVCISDI